MAPIKNANYLLMMIGAVNHADGMAFASAIFWGFYLGRTHCNLFPDESEWTCKADSCKFADNLSIFCIVPTKLCVC
jgi:hypothetical protein